MSDTSRPYMASSYFGAMRTPRTSKAGPHSEGKKPYHAGDYLEMELYDITDVPPYVDSPLTEPPSTPPPGEPPTPGGEEDPCAKADRVYLARASPSSISGCNGTESKGFTLYISPDFKCPALFQLTTLSSGAEVRFNDQPMIVDGIAQRFPLYTKETTEDGETVKSASGTITIDFGDCGNHSPWMMLAVAEECPCPGDTNLPIYSACTILLDQCVAHCVNCENPNCDDCPMVISGGPAGGRASLSTSYNYTLTGAVGSVVWTTNNAGTTLSGASSSGVTLDVGADACNYNNGGITLTATDTRGENVCVKTKSAQAGTWVLVHDVDYTPGLEPTCKYVIGYPGGGCFHITSCTFIPTSDPTTQYYYEWCCELSTGVPYPCTSWANPNGCIDTLNCEAQIDPYGRTGIKVLNKEKRWHWQCP